MTTITGGVGGYTDTYSRLQAALEEEQLMAQAKKVNQEEGSASGASAVGNDIMSYLAKIPKGGDGKLSFKDVDDYRKELELEWDLGVMADLEAQGVDITNQFVMTYDPDTGKVTVSQDHPDKETINQYFEDNPDKVEEFHTIIQLGKLTSKANSQLSQNQLMQNLRQESLAWWYEDNSDPTGWFSGGGLTAAQGQSSYTGINLKV